MPPDYTPVGLKTARHRKTPGNVSCGRIRPKFTLKYNCKSTISRLVRTFVMIGTVWSVSCSLFSTPGAPVPSHLSKWGDTGPSTPILYGVGDCSRATVLTVDLESSCSKCVLRPNVCMQMTTLKTVQKPGLAKRHPM